MGLQPGGMPDADTLATTVATVRCSRGHYRPPASCRIEPALLLRNGSIAVPGQPATGSKGLGHHLLRPHQQGGSLQKMFRAVNATQDALGQCRALMSDASLGDIAVAFSIYFHFGKGNYYHFFFDSLIPLYALLEHRGLLQQGNGVLMPFVEHGALAGFDEGIDLDSEAFSHQHHGAYWMQALQLLFPSWRILPLTRDSLLSLALSQPHVDYPRCLPRLVAGVPKWKAADAALVGRFVSFTVRQMALPPTEICAPGFRRSATVIRRSNRRRIRNFDEVLRTVEAEMPATMLRFEDYTLREQLALARSYALLVGMQGAGFINALFMSRDAAVVVLFQYGAASDSFGKLLRPRLSYHRWINEHRALSFTDTTRDPYHDNADTIVSINEFQAVVRKAVSKICSRIRAN